MKIAVTDAATLGSDLDLSPLSEIGELTVYQNSVGDEIKAHLDGAEVAVVNKIHLNETNLSGNTTLKLICLMCTGYDNIDTVYCRERGIAVCNVVDYSTQSVAQLTVAMALYLANHIGNYRETVKSGEYTERGIANILTPVFHELYGKTWGVAGYGNIGKQVASVARAFGCRVIAYKRTPEPDVECVDLDTLCRESDILSLHLPLTDSTRGLFSAEKIAMLKKDCIFINAARGAITDESALAEAVKSGSIGGLGTDVYSKEPFDKEHPFYSIKAFDNVCFTPHMAWGATEARKRCLREVIENIKAFYKGETRCRVDL